MPGPALAIDAEMSVTAGWPTAFEKAKAMLTPSLSKTTRWYVAGTAGTGVLLGPDSPARPEQFHGACWCTLDDLVPR